MGVIQVVLLCYVDLRHAEDGINSILVFGDGGQDAGGRVLPVGGVVVAGLVVLLEAEGVMELLQSLLSLVHLPLAQHVYGLEDLHSL